MDVLSHWTPKVGTPVSTKYASFCLLMCLVASSVCSDSISNQALDPELREQGFEIEYSPSNLPNEVALDDGQERTESDQKQDFIQITDLPKFVDQRKFHITARYTCIGYCNLYVHASIIGRDGRKLSSISSHSGGRRLSTTYPLPLLNRKGNFSFFVVIPTEHLYYDSSKLLVPTNSFSSTLQIKLVMHSKTYDKQYSPDLRKHVTEKTIPFVPPLSRQYLPGFSVSWFAGLRRRINNKNLISCSNHEGVVELLSSVAAVSGNEAGFMRKIEDPHFPSDTPLHIRKDITRTTRFESTRYGSVESKTTAQKPFYGSLHVQLHRENGQGEAFVTAKVPLRRWISIILSVNEDEASLLIADDGVGMSHTVYVHNLQDVTHCNVSQGFWNVGGYHSFAGITGFVGPTRLYKYRYIIPHDIHLNEKDKAIVLGSGVLQLASKCHMLVSAVDNFLAYGFIGPFTGSCHKRLSLYNSLRGRSCTSISANTTDFLTSTRKLSPTVNKSLHYVLSTLQKMSVSSPSPTSLAKIFYGIGQNHYFSGNQSTVLLNLEIAGCFGSSRAFYEAGAMLTSGFLPPRKPQKALQYQLIAAMHGNGLALMALGYKHQLGSDGVQKNCFTAAGYIRSAGLISKHLIENEQAEVHTHSELIRLDEANKVANFRGEKSDVVKWLSQQAKAGSSEAQGKIAEILFHGHHGVDINRNRAIDFYRLGAHQGDPMALYNLGVLYLRGIEVEKNETKGMELFLRSAAKNFSMAFNSLGYVEMAIRKNNTAAAYYFRRGIELDDRESMFHYGTLVEGGLGDRLPDKAAALKYYKDSAERGQKAACLKVGEAILLKELPRAGCFDTVRYYRYVAEQLSHLGSLLRQGLDNYLAGHWKKSMLGYLFAAEAGLALGAYNMALLCEEYEETRRFFNGSCETYFFNLSAELGYSAALIAMGDRAWHGKGMKKDVRGAAIYYARALESGEVPQALFGLGYLVEHNHDVTGVQFSSIEAGGRAAGNQSLALSLYERCMKNPYREYEGYYPCLLANLVLKMKIAISMPHYKIVAGVAPLLLTFIFVLAYLAGDDIT